MIPDKHFIVDIHPHYPQLVIGAGFSGHGFKFTTLMGQILIEGDDLLTLNTHEYHALSR